MTVAPPVDHQRLWDLIDEYRASLRAIIARCDTGQPFTREEQTDMLEALVDACSVNCSLVRLTQTLDLDQLIAQADQLRQRFQHLEQRFRDNPSEPS